MIKLNILSILILIVLTFSASAQVDEPQSIQKTSPDKKFSIEHRYIPENEFIIKDLETGVVTKFNNPYSVPKIEWTPDSKAALAVLGASGQSTLGVISLNGDKWSNDEIGAPTTFEGVIHNPHIIKWKFTSNTIEIFFVFECNANNPQKEGLYKSSAKLNLANKKYYNVVCKKISEKEFMLLRTQELKDIWGYTGK